MRGIGALPGELVTLIGKKLDTKSTKCVSEDLHSALSGDRLKKRTCAETFK